MTCSSSGANRPACPLQCSALPTTLLRIPIAEGNRSLNVAIAAAIAVFEALRQTRQLR